MAVLSMTRTAMIVRRRKGGSREKIQTPQPDGRGSPEPLLQKEGDAR